MVRWLNWEQFNGLLRMLVTVDREFFNAGSNPVLTTKIKNMEKIIFYVGILPEDSQVLLSYISSINEDVNENESATIEGTFDDPHGYFEYVIKGTWDCYHRFLGKPFVKSLSHYEE